MTEIKELNFKDLSLTEQEQSIELIQYLDIDTEKVVEILQSEHSVCYLIVRNKVVIAFCCMDGIILRFIRVHKDYRRDKLCRLLVTYVNLHHKEYMLYTHNVALLHIYDSQVIYYNTKSELTGNQTNRIHYKK